MVMPCRPSSPICGQRSRGNWLSRSIASARGAIFSCEKDATVSRMASAVSPRSKLKAGAALGIMGRVSSTYGFCRFIAAPRALSYAALVRSGRADAGKAGGAGLPDQTLVECGERDLLAASQTMQRISEIHAGIGKIECRCKSFRGFHGDLTEPGKNP